MLPRRLNAFAVGVLLLLCLHCYCADGSNNNDQSNNDQSNNGQSNNDQNKNDQSNNNQSNNGQTSYNRGTPFLDYHDIWVTEKVYMTISIGGETVGNITFGLFYNAAPRTVLNFRALIIGTRTDPDGNFLAYKGSNYHRTIKNFMIQGGDFTQGNGYGGMSIYGKNFPDENMEIKHYGAGWLGMANAGLDTNGSQFYITCVLTPWLDGKHVIFGIVLDGMSVVRAIENNPTGSNDRPIKPVIIEDCGTIPLSQVFTVPKAPVQG